MIKIVAKTEVIDKNKVSGTCDVEIEGKGYTIVCELASILTTIEKKCPGIIGDALQLMIHKERGRV